MKTYQSVIVLLAAIAPLLALCGCGGDVRRPNLAAIYNDAAQNIGDARNPVIVIPGILGSKLESPETQTPVWGAFTYGAADTDTPEGARLVALPMSIGTPTGELRDGVVATEVLDRLTVDVALLRGLQIGAYVDILRTLGVGGYRDETLGEAGAIDYGGLHYTCFQFPYDWRRDVSEQAALLHTFVLDAISAQPEGGERVDVVAHSMGGLVLRYYLRYGPDPLPDDGSLPELDWEGARYVENAVLVGTPSAGSAHSLLQLIDGVRFVSLISPKYHAAILGTMPAVYQLLPRTRHGRVVDAGTGEALDIFDPKLWSDMEWGLADPEQDRLLEQLLPGVTDPSERRAIAVDHLGKMLSRASQLHAALDTPATPPAGTSIHLIAGDTYDTVDLVEVDRSSGRTHEAGVAPGDKTVTRASALMDERVGRPYMPRLRTPIAFGSVQFLTSDHLGLTRDPLFVNSVLYTLLERPRQNDPGIQ